MPFTKEVSHSVEVKEDGTLYVRREVKILEDGEEIATRFSRKVIKNGDDVSGEPLRIRKIANAVWS